MGIDAQESSLQFLLHDPSGEEALALHEKFPEIVEAYLELSRLIMFEPLRNPILISSTTARLDGGSPSSPQVARETCDICAAGGVGSRLVTILFPEVIIRIS